MKHSIHKDLRPVIEEAEARGWTLVELDRRVHPFRLQCDGCGRYVTISGTPRNPWRAAKNMRAQLKRHKQRECER